MRRSGTILTLALVAAVLCADRAVTAAVEVRPQVVEAARAVAIRLTARMNGTMHAARPAKLDGPTVRPILTGRIDPVGSPGSVCSPERFPIPPPVCRVIFV